LVLGTKEYQPIENWHISSPDSEEGTNKLILGSHHSGVFSNHGNQEDVAGKVAGATEHVGSTKGNVSCCEKSGEAGSKDDKASASKTRAFPQSKSLKIPHGVRIEPVESAVGTSDVSGGYPLGDEGYPLGDPGG